VPPVRGPLHHLRARRGVLPSVIKKDGRREPYDRVKILSGLTKACEKRPISVEVLEKAVDGIEKCCRRRVTRRSPARPSAKSDEPPSMPSDEVAYVRFASVYPFLQGHQRVHERAQGHPEREGRKGPAEDEVASGPGAGVRVMAGALFFPDPCPVPRDPMSTAAPSPTSPFPSISSRPSTTAFRRASAERSRRARASSYRSAPGSVTGNGPGVPGRAVMRGSSRSSRCRADPVPEDLMAPCRWMSDYYLHPLGLAIETMVPKAVASSAKRTRKLLRPP